MADIQALIQKVYEFSCVGGHLHIVTDDFNVHDSDLKFCSDLIDAGGYGADVLKHLYLSLFRNLSISLAAISRYQSMAVACGFFITWTSGQTCLAIWRN